MRTNEEIVRILIDEKNKQNLSISELARRVDMAKSAISRYFNFSREFPLNRADDFARALGISTEYLLGISKDEMPNKTKKQSPIVEEINKISSQLEEPRQKIVLETANVQLKEQEEQNKVKQIEDYRLTDEYLEEQISKASAYGGGQLNDNDKEFFKRLLKNTLKEKIDKGDL
ncbi:helix-turn-helix domain-containing protein [Lactococcus lactis]|uniref:Predicted transcriptional regulators n=1 Tax=Lactococcus lactis subsp. lactis TaxID=1360 RepID=A0A0B8QNC3_LACLL|nr:helix-turn-helix transcriptional regulator [Lactococcus lactis]KST82509.1 putative repressor protein - phage associated [Lactococcus lactis subsp. lactis]MBU3886222.1 helix-turn-helix domain-containing protein [Lactococcus lactis]MCT3119722.1 XRE family transcriptional regulator [Lactococcus lactis]MDX6024460.1 helix-turn-helix transcriptional regulator [Lactococcus lactis subsp. lactis]PCS17987.1 repressor [Lactococcus lactis subsp. lactis]